jgi:Tol biopolymer transport system component
VLRVAPANSASAPPPSAHDLSMSYEGFSETPPPPASINVFGEFDGVERGKVKAIGEVGFQQHTFVIEGYDGDVSVDPTGHYIVYSSTRHSEHPQIYMQRVDGTSVVQLTSDSADNAYPVFSHDGKQIAFCSTRSGNWDVYVMDADGRNVVQVTSGPNQDLHPTFAPDGKRIAYCSIGGRSNQWELWTADLKTSEKRMIGFGLFPDWSPDKSVDRIAYQRARARGSRWFSLWTMDLVDGEARNITEVAVSANAAIVSPSWSPDGRKLAFATIVEPARIDGKGKPEGQQDIWTINADGSNRHRLTDGNGTNLLPCWAADNRVYFISDRSGTECVWSGQADAPPTKMADRKEEAPKPAVGSSDTRETH